MRATTPSSCVRRRSCGAVRVVERRTWPVMPTCTHSKQTGAAAAAAEVRSGPVRRANAHALPLAMHARGAPPPRGKSDGHLRSPLRPTRAFHYSTARARPPDSKCPAGPAPVARSCMRGAPPGAGRSIGFALADQAGASGRNGARMLRTLRRRTENGTEYECRAS